MFHRRASDKRHRQVAVRVSDKELEALEWCAEQLTRREGEPFIVSDVLRAGIAKLYEELQTDAAKPVRPGRKATPLKR